MKLEFNYRTKDNVFDALNVSLPTIFRAIYSGKIKAVKMGKGWRVSEEEVERIKREGF